MYAERQHLILHPPAPSGTGVVVPTNRDDFRGHSWQESLARGGGKLPSEGNRSSPDVTKSLLWLLKLMKHLILAELRHDTRLPKASNQLRNLNTANSKTSSHQAALQSFCFPRELFLRRVIPKYPIVSQEKFVKNTFKGVLLSGESNIISPPVHWAFL